MENAILAGQQKRQGLLLHLGGHDIPNLLSPLQDVVRDAAGADLTEGGGGGGNSGGASRLRESIAYNYETAHTPITRHCS